MHSIHGHPHINPFPEVVSHLKAKNTWASEREREKNKGESIIDNEISARDGGEMSPTEEHE